MGAKRPDGSSAKTVRVTFTKSDAERIAKVVRRAEQGDRVSRGPSWTPHMDGGGGGSAIRLCKFSGTWPIGNNKTVTFTGETNTAIVTNLFFDIGVSCGQRDAAITKIGGAWHLIAASCA